MQAAKLFVMFHVMGAFAGENSDTDMFARDSRDLFEEHGVSVTQIWLFKEKVDQVYGFPEVIRVRTQFKPEKTVSSEHFFLDYSMAIAKEKIRQESNMSNLIDLELEVKQNLISFMDSPNYGVGEKEEPSFRFTFRFPTYEEFSKNRGRNGDFDGFEACSATNTNKFEFISGESFSDFIDEPKVMGSEVKKVNTDTNFGFLLDEGFKKVDKDETEEFDELVLTEEEAQTVNAQNNLVSDENVSAGVKFPTEKENFSMERNHLDSILTQWIDSYGDGFLSDGQFDNQNIEDENKESHQQNLETFNLNFLSKKEFDEKKKRTMEFLVLRESSVVEGYEYEGYEYDRCQGWRKKESRMERRRGGGGRTVAGEWRRGGDDNGVDGRAARKGEQKESREREMRASKLEKVRKQMGPGVQIKT
ncbi:hypothetical protein LguiB_020493 [Lonicera macranthoides]